MCFLPSSSNPELLQAEVGLPSRAHRFAVGSDRGSSRVPDLGPGSLSSPRLLVRNRCPGEVGVRSMKRQGSSGQAGRGAQSSSQWFVSVGRAPGRALGRAPGQRQEQPLAARSSQQKWASRLCVAVTLGDLLMDPLRGEPQVRDLLRVG